MFSSCVKRPRALHSDLASISHVACFVLFFLPVIRHRVHVSAPPNCLNLPSPKVVVPLPGLCSGVRDSACCMLLLSPALGYDIVKQVGKRGKYLTFLG